MKHRHPTDKVEGKQTPPMRPLLRLSLILWLLSLPLPAFYIDEENSLWLGIFVLLVGLPLGWLGAGLAGLAVYANIFYYYAFRKLSTNKTHFHCPDAAVCQPIGISPSCFGQRTPQLCSCLRMGVGCDSLGNVAGGIGLCRVAA